MVAASLHIYNAAKPLLESRDEWLGIRDWGLGASVDRNSANGALTVLQERSLDFARDDDAREALSKLRGASLFFCAAPPFLIPHS